MPLGNMITFAVEGGAPFEVDSALWVTRRGGQRGYILGNRHTYPGHFGIFLPEMGYHVTVNLSDLEGMSDESECWIRGFIVGAEPSLYEYLGIQFRVLDGDTWVEADPQPPNDGYFLDGTLCAERGTSDLACFENDLIVCLDCGEVSDNG